MKTQQTPLHKAPNKGGEEKTQKDTKGQKNKSCFKPPLVARNISERKKEKNNLKKQ